MSSTVQSILDRYGSDRTRLLDVLWDVQDQFGYIPDDAVRELAAGMNTTPLDIRETASFYHFFRSRPGGRYTLYLSNTAIAKMQGLGAVSDALQAETGARFGGVDPSGTFALEHTSCIGLSDQEPAMLVDKVVFTHLTPDKVADIVARLRQGETPEQIANPDSLPAHRLEYVDALVESNVHQSGPVFFDESCSVRQVLERCLARHPEELILVATESGLRGRGGAGFSVGLKWRLCRESESRTRYVICNADEGEPGTFKDRVLLTRSPLQVFAGMIIAAYATGAQEGIVYLRAEYFYLKAYLEAQLQALRDDALLGHNILGRGIDFDIRIQMGAGAYVCGDESALIESCEGKRGTPRLKPPFPVYEGYLGKPTAVCNVETFATVTRVMELGARWFEGLGTEDSAGTRLLSISGDCARPGIYEIEWGVTLNQVLALVGARNARAVQLSGPSGECVSVEQDGHRRFCYSDLSCNGSMMVFNHSRDLLGVVRDFMQFFVDESCGICTPCRSGNEDLLRKVDLFIEGKAQASDIEDLRSWGKMIQRTSRCGLGGTSPKPILTTLGKFPELYAGAGQDMDAGLIPSFDHDRAFSAYDRAHAALQKERS
ncbi:MAG: NAD(P)H-dependent oxidoreductase subunit E [Halieaceae bacterium]|jgi:[NiFe] hydrogenase diaphorase moiety large subunit|nr:NAD(P)H-dependent oxidoreductase subunit E [Halieaceae bacterium]